MDADPNPKYRPYVDLQCHHDRLCVINLKAAQEEEREFLQTANGRVLGSYIVQP